MGTLAWFRRLLRRVPFDLPGLFDNLRLFNDLGLTLIALDEREEAAAAFLRAIEIGADADGHHGAG